MKYLIAVFITLAIINAISVLFEYGSCSERGGRLVQGFSINGYVCVEGK